MRDKHLPPTFSPTTFPRARAKGQSFAMAPTLEPEAEISPLPNPDGSVAFSYAGYKVIASANGPIETVKRDEYAFEAHVDVVVRPPAGVGGKNPLTRLASAVPCE